MLSVHEIVLGVQNQLEKQQRNQNFRKKKKTQKTKPTKIGNVIPRNAPAQKKVRKEIRQDGHDSDPLRRADQGFLPYFGLSLFSGVFIIVLFFFFTMAWFLFVW